MKENDLRGIVPILQAPFNEDGTQIIYEDLEREIEACVLDGVSGAVLFGVATEFYMLADDECINMVKTAVKAAKGRIPIFASITRDSTALAIRDAKTYRDLGVDGLMMFSPHFYKPSTKMLQDHIIELANSTDLPFMIQYAPQNGGGIMTAQSVKEIREAVKGTLFIKAEPQPAGPFITQLVEADIKPLGILCGNGGRYMINILDRGCQGIMPGCSHQKIYVDIFNLWDQGKKKEAFELFELMNRNQRLGIGANAGYKEILVERGIFTTNVSRKPCPPPPSPEMRKKAVEEWKELAKYTDVGCIFER